MPILHGRMRGGYFEVNRKINFADQTLIKAQVQNPFSVTRFVDGINGSDLGGGKTPDAAVATIQKSVDLSARDDVVIIRPQTYKLGTGFNRYTEDVSVALGGAGGAGVVATKANISIIGITPRTVPKDFLGVRWTFATAIPLLVDAPCLHIENIGFFVEDATKAIHLRCNGATRTREGTTGFSMYNCAVKGNAKVYAEGGDEISIVKCRFQAKYDGAVGGIELVGSANQVKRPIIADCEFIGGNGTVMSGPCIVGAAPWLDAMIRDCYFGGDPTGNIYINIAGSSSSGQITNCHFACADVSTGRIVEGGLICTGIYDGGGLATAT